MLTYAREVPEGNEAAVQNAADHVRAHLSSVVSPDDDENAYSAEVVITFSYRDGNVYIAGAIDREPDASYLKHDYDPNAEQRHYTFTPYYPGDEE